MPALHLIRHGETTSNVLRRLDTRLPGAGLTDFGARQAVRYGLANADATPAALLCSPARRAQETAALIGGVWGVEPVVVQEIYEVQVGDIEDRYDEEAHRRFSAAVRQWYVGDSSLRLAGGESLDEVVARFSLAVDAVVAESLSGGDDDVYMVSHGAAIRLIAAYLSDIPKEFALRHHLNNVAEVVLDFTPGAPTLGDAATPGHAGSWTCTRWGRHTPPFADTEVVGLTAADPAAESIAGNPMG